MHACRSTLEDPTGVDQELLALRALDRVVQRCLQKRPSERFVSWAAFGAALSAVEAKGTDQQVGSSAPAVLDTAEASFRPRLAALTKVDAVAFAAGLAAVVIIAGAAHAMRHGEPAQAVASEVEVVTVTEPGAPPGTPAPKLAEASAALRVAPEADKVIAPSELPVAAEDSEPSGEAKKGVVQSTRPARRALPVSAAAMPEAVPKSTDAKPARTSPAPSSPARGRVSSAAAPDSAKPGPARATPVARAKGRRDAVITSDIIDPWADK